MLKENQIDLGATETVVVAEATEIVVVDEIMIAMNVGVPAILQEIVLSDVDMIVEIVEILVKDVIGIKKYYNN